MSQTKGRFDVYNFTNFKLHVYNSNDVMADTSYIVEGDASLVCMEQPLFKDNAAEFDAYVDRLGKPVEQRVTNYHVGGTAHHACVMPAGMPAFTKGPVYGGMMAHFQQTFGDAMVALPDGPTSEVGFGETRTWAGVTFRFEHGAATDFPGAALIIGGCVYYTHWTPAQAHPSQLQLSSAAAVDAELAATQAELNSGCTLFVGGHGGAVAREAVAFRAAYLEKLKELLAARPSAEALARELREAYPGLPGDEGVDALAAALCQA